MMRSYVFRLDGDILCGMVKYQIEELPIERDPLMVTLVNVTDKFPNLNEDFHIFQDHDCTSGFMLPLDVYRLQPRIFDTRFYHPLSWYQAALKNAVVQEDFEEAAMLKKLIKTFEGAAL